MIQSPIAVNRLVQSDRKSETGSLKMAMKMVASAGFLCVMATAASAFTADDAPSGSYVYQVTRQGEVIGEQRLTFERQGSNLVVSTDAKVDVKLLGLSLYGFDQHTEETWTHGKMVGVSSTADDDGQAKKVEMTLQAGQLSGTYNGKTRTAPLGVFPNSFWNEDSIKQTQILDTSRGKVRQVTVADKGKASITLPYGSVTAHHYSIDGDMKRELWYDEKGVLVAGELAARDGSVVRQELLRAP